MKIVITDSGLGGLSVAAELERRLLINPIYENVELIYFSSLYSNSYGYNSMKDLSEQAKVFNNALNSMKENYNPDLILIACNTLSIIYPHTEFAKNSGVQVKGIVESGINLYSDSLQNNSNKIILMGTPITINSNVYKNALLNNGIDEKRIVNQPCLELETPIQNNPSSDETRKAISEFAKLAIESIGEVSQKTYIGFCCTHYGYSEEMFFSEFSENLNSEIEILNPNNKMLDFLFANSEGAKTNSKLSIKVVSRVKFINSEIILLSKIIDINSPRTANALENYEFIENLFEKT